MCKRRLRHTQWIHLVVVRDQFSMETSAMMVLADRADEVFLTECSQIVETNGGERASARRHDVYSASVLLQVCPCSSSVRLI
jgi:hypothetical protein